MREAASENMAKEGENGEQARKLKGNGERMRKCRERMGKWKEGEKCR